MYIDANQVFTKLGNYNIIITLLFVEHIKVCYKLWITYLLEHVDVMHIEWFLISFLNCLGKCITWFLMFLSLPLLSINLNGFFAIHPFYKLLLKLLVQTGMESVLVVQNSSKRVNQTITACVWKDVGTDPLPWSKGLEGQWCLRKINHVPGLA